MFFDGWVTSLLYLSRVFFVSSRAFAIDECALLPALMKRSVSLMPWVRLLSALCAGAVCAAGINGVASRAVSRTPAARAIVSCMVLTSSINGWCQSTNIHSPARLACRGCGADHAEAEVLRQTTHG